MKLAHKDIMIDLETLGTVPGCAIVSIGAIGFDEFGVAERGFYRAIEVGAWDEPGLTAEGLLKDGGHPQGTIEFWKRQSDEARAVFSDPGAVPLQRALSELARYISDHGSPRIWGNGADFDNPIIAVAAHKVGLDPKNIWKPFNGRCYRTVKNQFKDVKLVRQGTYHNALDDARSQAAHLVEICKTRGWRLV